MIPVNSLKQAKLFAFVPGYGLQLVDATKNELVMARAMLKYLRQLIIRYDQTGRQARTHTKLFGDMTYTEHSIKRGNRTRHIHVLSFATEENVFYYDEMRHALQIAIFGLCGEPVALQVDMTNTTASWQFASGASLTGLV